MRTLGFDPDGGAILKAQPDFDEEGMIDPASCVKKEGLWVLHNGLTPLADAYKMKRYGHLFRDAATAGPGRESQLDGAVEVGKTP